MWISAVLSLQLTKTLTTTSSSNGNSILWNVTTKWFLEKDQVFSQLKMGKCVLIMTGGREKESILKNILWLRWKWWKTRSYQKNCKMKKCFWWLLLWDRRPCMDRLIFLCYLKEFILPSECRTMKCLFAQKGLHGIWLTKTWL